MQSKLVFHCLKKSVDFYIQSSLHVALAVFAFIQITSLHLQLPFDAAVSFFGFFGTIVGYNFIKYDQLARVKKIELNNTFKSIIALSILASLATFYFFLELKNNTKIIGVGALLITILYTLPFFPNIQNMRNWSGLKIYMVAIAWVVVTVFLPAINAEIAFSTALLLQGFQRFLLVFVLMLPFEIMDLKNDDEKLHTIPQKIGVKKTKFLGYFLLLFFCFIRCFSCNFQIIFLFLNILIAVLIAFLLYFTSSNKNQYYTTFWVESVPVFWWLSFFILL